jgi:hypothetical protein
MVYILSFLMTLLMAIAFVWIVIRLKAWVDGQ